MGHSPAGERACECPANRSRVVSLRPLDAPCLPRYRPYRTAARTLIASGRYRGCAVALLDWKHRPHRLRIYIGLGSRVVHARCRGGHGSRPRLPCHFMGLPVRPHQHVYRRDDDPRLVCGHALGSACCSGASAPARRPDRHAAAHRLGASSGLVAAQPGYGRDPARRFRGHQTADRRPLHGAAHGSSGFRALHPRLRCAGHVVGVALGNH